MFCRILLLAVLSAGAAQAQRPVSFTPEGWDQGVAADYSVRAIPQNFLLDPAGRIIATNLHGAELQSTLARVLPAAP